jgi:hypothetical protein
MTTTPKQTRINQLEAHHLASYNALSPSLPQSSTAHASSLSLTATEAQHRLSILVDEGLAVQAKGPKGQTLDSYTQAS